MNWFQYFVVATLTLTTFSIVIMSLFLKNRLTGMSRMILAMVTGMSTGVTAGVLFGSIYQGNLYYSTVLSILIGALAGLASGMFMGILPALEGFMSGLMGGMMGAMLGDMVTQSQSVSILNILLALCVSSLLLFKILPHTKDKGPERSNKKWLLKPILTFLFLSAYLLLGNQLNQWTQTKSDPSIEGEHINHGDQKIQEETN